MATRGPVGPPGGGSEAAGGNSNVMSVKPATDEQLEVWKAAWLSVADDAMFWSDTGEPESMGAMLAMVFARIEADRTRAEEAEALLRSITPTLKDRMRGLKEDGHGDNFEEWARLRSLLGFIEAHLQEHTDAE